MNIVSMLVIYNDQAEILLQDRSNIRVVDEDYSFFWWHLEDWENPEQTLKREIKEELNIELKKDYEFLGVWNKNVYKTGKNYDIYFYLYKTDNLQENFNDREGSGAKYFTLDQAKKLRFVADFQDVLDFIEQKIKNVFRNTMKK